MTTYGANPDELAGLGRTLTSQIERVDTMIAEVEGPLNSIVWTGPAKDRFVAEWNDEFRAALRSLNEAFQAAGRDCEQRAEGLRTVMGVA